MFHIYLYMYTCICICAVVVAIQQNELLTILTQSRSDDQNLWLSTKRENLTNSGFCRPSRTQSKNEESEKRDKYSESVVEIETHRHLGDFEIQIYYLTSAIWQDLGVVNNNKKENLPNSGLCRPSRPESKILRKPGPFSEKWKGGRRIKRSPTDNSDLYIKRYKTRKNILLTNVHGWVPVFLSASFILPCATYVLWRKQKAGNTHLYKNEINNS